MSMDLQLGNALSHPLRIVVLNALTQGAATPQQLAEDLGGSVDPIFYHLRVLTKAGFVRPA
jgi:DNA-binding transcriptional ArsR family regulator